MVKVASTSETPKAKINAAKINRVPILDSLPISSPKTDFYTNVALFNATKTARWCGVASQKLASGSSADRRNHGAMIRPQKITLAEMRASGIRGLLICCSDYHCSHSITLNADQWPDKTRLSDLAGR